MKPPSLLLVFTPVFIHTISLFLFVIHLGINIIKLVINFVPDEKIDRTKEAQCLQNDKLEISGIPIKEEENFKKIVLEITRDYKRLQSL